MNLYAITNNPTTGIGLELADVKTQLACTQGEFRKALAHIPQGVSIVITENLAAEFPDLLNEYRAKNPKILVTIIPDL